MERFKNGDSTMTIDEKRHLYYGYTFEDSYSPYSRSKYGDSLREILKKSELNDKELNNMHKFTDSMLMEKPFNFDVMNYQLYVFDKKQDTIPVLTD